MEAIMEKITDEQMVRTIMQKTGHRYEGRELFISSFEGAYGTAGFVLCVNGSPPRGTFVVLTTSSEFPNYDGFELYALNAGKAKHFDSWRHSDLHDFVRLFLEQRGYLHSKDWWAKIHGLVETE